MRPAQTKIESMRWPERIQEAAEEGGNRFGFVFFGIRAGELVFPQVSGNNGGDEETRIRDLCRESAI